LLLDRLNQL
nr:Chain C, Nucleoprotein [Severe acute respiratory syndrome coronavirus 2]8DNT_D Chain D, Nucleoprotein [Severe acute respiratory syndrome coronavirus 2]8DNT_J Chain J, Nucleoprotein [Severe acute respiratory syndrome coronavirus 2]8DNT_Q Chain Q, Nucleoprotein [Severe acute respiratory syndrome coronavirus 2]8DNT_X Chain X, Nucleoprotein [Severe acute respiratory syndrome coronavirus 2]